MTGRMRRARAGLVVMVLGALLGGVPGTAYAASDRLLVDVPGDTLGFVTGSTAPLLDFAGLEPGDHETGTLSLWNDSADDVELGLAVVDLVDGERGCVEPESNEGQDTSCGPEQGELSRWLRLTVTRTDQGSDKQLWSGDFDTLQDPVMLAGAMPADARWDLRIDVALRPEAGNDTMTDAVAFSMSWSARGVTNGDVVPPGADDPVGDDPVVDDPVVDDPVVDTPIPDDEVVVAGVEASRPGAGPPVAGVPLPFTGATVEPWLLWFAGVLVAGGCVLLAASRRQVRPAF